MGINFAANKRSKQNVTSNAATQTLLALGGPDADAQGHPDTVNLLTSSHTNF
jgi:hypothetical protein